MSFCLMKTQTVKKCDDVWLMPNKMINIARERKIETGEICKPKPVRPGVTSMTHTELTCGLDKKTSDAFIRAYECQNKINTKREKKKIKLIEFIPFSETTETGGSRTVSRADKLKCKAKTMAGKPCPFKASCGDFCKKHQQPDDGFKI